MGDFIDQYIQALTIDKDILVVGYLNRNLLKDCPDSSALKDLCYSFNLI